MPEVTPVPEHVGTVTPRLVVRNGAAAIDFYCDAFGAEEIAGRFTGANGEVVQAELRIGSSVIMITEESDPEGINRSPETVGAVTAILKMYWADVDAAWERAVAAGAEVVYQLDDHFYGERGGRLRDPFGQQWLLSQRTEILSEEEMNRRAAALFGNG